MARLRRILAGPVLALGLGLAAGVPAHAQDPGGEQTRTTQFQAADNEGLKYQYLWIAYGAIWLLIFGFVWRTWRHQQATQHELEDLRRRLASLEGKDA
jgi:CcmD family protein